MRWSRRWKEEREKREKKRRLFTVYRCRLRVTAKKPARRALGKAVKPWPDNVKRFLACKVGTFSFSLPVEKLPLSVSFVGKIKRRETTTSTRRTKIGRKEQDREGQGRRIGDEHGGRRPTILSSRFKTHTALVSCAHKSCACLGRPG